MRNYAQDYPGFVNPPDDAYPQGSPKNATTDTAEDGTPVEQGWVGDVWGFFQSLASEGGVAPNGQTESLANPQLVDALKSVIRKTSAIPVGLIGEFHTPNEVPGWIDLKGGELSRVTDKLLWDYAVAAGMTVSQATKDADPMTNAMKFGDGDGSTTFTLPNHHLGHFVRGNPVGVNHGETQNDAIRNLTGSFATMHNRSLENVTGVFSLAKASLVQGYQSTSGNESNIITLDASREVPTADENRPYTANLSVKIYRGWMQ